MKRLFIALLALMIALPAAHAQEREPYSQAEFDQMLAPIALYPDTLLSQVLMAATYPLEVVEAARWSRAHPGLRGDEAVRAAEDKEWDPSVKSLLAFPDLLARMDEKLDWTKQLGDAFLAQEQQMMDTVQQLRQRARAAGQLAPDERVRIVEDASTIVIESADPRVVYVPYYDPWVVYGPWWWSSYPPVLWAPWPGYVVYRPGFWWGAGVGISAGFFFGSVSWPHRHVVVTHVNSYYVRAPGVRRQVIAQRPIQAGRWQHDPAHRRGIVYRSADVQKRFAVAPAPQRELGRAARPAAVAPAPRTPERPGVRPEVRPETGRSTGGQRPAPQREERRDDRRGNAMPPPFRASASERIAPPLTQSQPRVVQPRVEIPRVVQPRVETPRVVQPRVEASRVVQPRVEAPRVVQPRVEAPRVVQPRVEAPRVVQPRVETPRVVQPRVEAPRVVQPRMGVQAAQPRMESRPQRSMEPRGGGNGGARSGGWRE